MGNKAKLVTLALLAVVGIPTIMVTALTRQNTQQHAAAPEQPPMYNVAQQENTQPTTVQNTTGLTPTPTDVSIIPRGCADDVPNGKVHNGTLDPALSCPGMPPIETYHCRYNNDSHTSLSQSSWTCPANYVCAVRGGDGEGKCLPLGVYNTFLSQKNTPHTQ